MGSALDQRRTLRARDAVTPEGWGLKDRIEPSTFRTLTRLGQVENQMRHGQAGGGRGSGTMYWKGPFPYEHNNKWSQDLDEKRRWTEAALTRFGPHLSSERTGPKAHVTSPRRRHA